MSPPGCPPNSACTSPGSVGVGRGGCSRLRSPMISGSHRPHHSFLPQQAGAQRQAGLGEGLVQGSWCPGLQSRPCLP